MAPTKVRRKLFLIVDSGLPPDLIKDEEIVALAFGVARERLASFFAYNDVHPWEYKLIERSLIGGTVALHISLKSDIEISKMYKPLDLEIVE